MNRPLEFVLLACPGLARRPDPTAFAEHFHAGSEEEVIVFPNRGGDAIMLVPCPRARPLAYGHLAAFVRQVPETQRHVLWQLVGATMTQRLGAKPVWLSTAGTASSQEAPG